MYVTRGNQQKNKVSRNRACSDVGGGALVQEHLHDLEECLSSSLHPETPTNKEKKRYKIFF